MKTGVSVGDAMTVSPVIVSHTATLRECARMMKRKGVGSLLVKDGKRIVGIVTEKDFVTKVLAVEAKLNIPVSKIMSKRLINIDPDQDLYDAMMMMRDEGVRRLPVMHQGELVGMLTANDMLKIEPQLFDYLFEKTAIREEEDKLRLKSETVGVCESCGRRARLTTQHGERVCRLCLD